MSLEMLGGIEELHERNAFDGDSSEATLSGSSIEVSETIGELFEKSTDTATKSEPR